MLLEVRFGYDPLNTLGKKNISYPKQLLFVDKRLEFKVSMHLYCYFCLPRCAFMHMNERDLTVQSSLCITNMEHVC